MQFIINISQQILIYMVFLTKNAKPIFFMTFFWGGMLSDVECQTGWAGSHIWAPGDNVKYWNTTPDQTNIRACVGSINTFNLEYRFTDLDEATCGLGALNTEYTAGSNYSITFTVTEPTATFTGGVQTITVNVSAAYPQIPKPAPGAMPPYGVTGTWYVYRSDQVELTLSAAWMGNPFDINVRIVDNPAPSGQTHERTPG
jgi:hypothetical protein